MLVEFGDGESGRRALGALRNRVEHVVLDPVRAMSRAAAPVLGSKRLATLVLDNFAIRPLVCAAPAIRELAILDVSRQVVAEHPGKRVVFDMPASGHSVAWLKIARQVRDATPEGPVHDLCARLEDELLSPGRASIAIITLPERLVLSETLILCDAVENDVGLPVDRLVVNRVPAALPPGALREAFRLSAKHGPTARAAEKLASCLEVRATVREQVMEALRETVDGHADANRGDIGLTLLPLAPREPNAGIVAARGGSRMMRPAVIVCAGGGGVGKTTTSAALSLALARRGKRVLVVSLDPARRLADALGAELGSRARKLSVDSGEGALFGLMPDPKDALHRFVEILAEDDPDVVERLRNNTVYRAPGASVPGVHELVSINLTWSALAEHAIDTAPSRNAMDFITYPKRLSNLLGGRTIGWMTGLGNRAARGGRMGRVERLLVWAIGPVVSDVSQFFTELAGVREQFVKINEHVSRLLLHPNTHYFLVAAPTTAARDDAQYLARRLKALRILPRAVILNSAFVPENEWLDVLEDSDLESEELRSVLSTLREESEIRERASCEVARTFSRHQPSLAQLRLPYV